MPTAPNLYGPSEDASRTAKTDREKQGEGAPKADSLLARYWREVGRYKKQTEAWYKEGDQIVQWYLDEARDKDGQDSRKFALLWANVETLKPAVYGRMPQVVCSRRFKDKDPVGRVCAELMERATNTTFDLYGADETFRLVRDDRLLPGRGQAWVRYEAQLDRYQDEDDEGQPRTDDDGQPVYREKLRNEKVCADYVYWCDFGHNVASTWADVWLVWRCVYKTRDEVAERWGEEKANALAYTTKPAPSGYDAQAKDSESENTPEDCCKIYEFWDKRKGLTSWAADNAREFLESGEPPIDFRNFFPCPEPCYATKTGKSLRPVPDYRYYRDQAKEINDLTEKIHRLTKWLIVKGFIPAAPSGMADPIEQAIKDQTNQELFVQVQSMTEWTESGGTGKLIDWLPIQHVVVALKAAIDARNQLINDVFQLTGVGETLRGETDERKTRGAVELEAQTGSRRLKNTKDEHARWCKDMAQLTAEVIAEKFQPENIAAITGYKYVPQAPAPAMSGLGGLPGMQQPVPSFPMGSPSPMQAPAAAPMQTPEAEASDTDAELVFDDRHVQLLRDDKLRSFRIEVETDQTDAADENAEKERRTEVLSVMGTYMKDAIPLVMMMPALAPAIKEWALFTLRAFRAGRSMEDVLERSFDQAIKQAQQAPKGDPKAEAEQAKVQLMAEKAKADVQLQQQKTQADIQLKQAELQGKMQLATQELQVTSAIKQQEAQQDAQLEAQKAQQEAAFRAQEHHANMRAADADRAMAARNADADRQLAERNAAADRKVKAQQAKNGGSK